MAPQDAQGDGQRSIEDHARALRRAADAASPRVAALAAWAADKPQEVAFNSVRRLAELSGANANTVVRLSRTLGYPGYEAMRRDFQNALRRAPDFYGQRAGALTGRDGASVMDAMREASLANVESAFAPAARAGVEAAAGLMLNARQVHVIGVRSCYAVADYLTYTGRMAFDNFAPRAAAPGDIRDQVAATGPEDVVLSITFRRYSVETIGAHELARARGARAIAMTDDHASPVAQGAEVVLLPEMAGPQPLPSMLAAFALAEALVTTMAARSDGALANIRRFEQRLWESGAYR